MPSHAEDSERDDGLDPELDDELDAALIDTSLEAARAVALFQRAMQGALVPGDAVDKGTCDFVTTVDFEAVLGGEEICRAFAGKANLTREMGGGFLAGNGRLEPILRELWSEAMLEDAAVKPAKS